MLHVFPSPPITSYPHSTLIWRNTSLTIPFVLFDIPEKLTLGTAINEDSAKNPELLIMQLSSVLAKSVAKETTR